MEPGGQQNNWMIPWEHKYTKAFLARRPKLDHLQLHPYRRTLSEIIASAEGRLNSPAVNILVLELDYIVTRHRLRSANELAEYLRENIGPKRRTYLVSQDSLSDTVVGLLGARLELDPDFFALHLTRPDLPLGLSLPSSTVASQSVRFSFRRNIQNLPIENISFSVSQISENAWTGQASLALYAFANSLTRS
jgi:hypothetical protein